jgi:hypothetical protein
MKRFTVFWIISFFILAICMLIPLGYKEIAPGIIRSDFGWPMYTLSIFADQPVPNYLFALSLGIRLRDFAVQGTDLIINYLLINLFLRLLYKCIRQFITREHPCAGVIMP